jgi:hypothetical protein
MFINYIPRQIINIFQIFSNINSNRFKKFKSYKLLINCMICFLLLKSTLTLLAVMTGGLFVVIFLVMHFAITKNDCALG